jgi:DNA-binding transcriptional MerR regulator
MYHFKNNLYLYPMPSQLQLFDLGDEAPKKEKKEVKTTGLTKVYYTITEVAAMFDVNASLLRFWEKEFPVQLGKLKKNKKGDRYYTKDDIDKVKTIFHLTKEKGMTLQGAHDYLKNTRRKVQDDKTLIENLSSIKQFLLDLKRNISNESI